MYFPLLMLLERAGIFLPETTHPFQDIMLRDIRLLTPELKDYQAHTLYVGQSLPRGLPAHRKQDTWCILLSRQTGADAPDSMEHPAVSEQSEGGGFSGILPVVAKENLFVLFNRMLEIMDQFRLFKQQLEQLGRPGYPENQKEGLQEMIRLISGIMGNPAYLTDSGFKTLAIDPAPLFSEISSIWRHLSRYGYLPYDIVYNLRKAENSTKSNRQTSPCCSGRHIFITRLSDIA